jgi:HTH-type transcriptional regulator/antitoxin HipB
MRINAIRDVAAAVRGRRLDAGMSQADLARRAGVSRKWVYEFEAGKPAAELGLVLRVLDALDLELDLSPRAERADQQTTDLDALLAELRDRDD